MKLIPSRIQWEKWTLPSKASYIGIPVAFALAVIGMSYSWYANNYVKKSDQPKLLLTLNTKPYLRYEIQNSNDITFMYEISISNLGKNNAHNISWIASKQKLSVNGSIVGVADNLMDEGRAELEKSNKGPKNLFSGEKIFKILYFKAKNVEAEKLKYYISAYERNKLSIIFEASIKYDDEVTGVTFTTNKILDIRKNNVYIIE